VRAAVCLACFFLLLLGLDRLFPPNLGRLAATGSEIRDRSGRTLA
jgi:hypothetical protein